MDKETTPTAEELQVEQESLAEVQDDDLRSSLIDSLGLEANEDNEDLISKLVEREREHRSKLSGAIGTKIKYREQLSQFKSSTANNQPKVENDADAIRKQQEAIVAERFNEEYLEDSDFSDNIKQEIREWTKYKGVSAKAASKAPHIATMIDAFAKEQQLKEAAQNGGGSKGGAKTGDTGVPDRFTAAYMATEEGRKDYDAWSSSQ